MSERLKRSLILSLAGTFGIFLGEIIIDVHRNWIELLSTLILVYVLLFAGNYLLIQKDRDKKQ